MTQVSKIAVVILGIIALGVGLSQNTNVNAAVFVTGDNNIIQLGTFIETTPGNVPVSIYYNQANSTFYYTWYSASRGYDILKSYDTYTYKYSDSWGKYHKDGYSGY